MPVVRDDLGAAGHCGDGFDRGADVGLGVAAGTDVMQRRYARKLHRALCKLAEGAASY